MRLSRFFSERKNIRVGSSVKLSDRDIEHIRKVLRLKKGDSVIVFNGEKEFLAKLTLVKKDVILVKIEKVLKEVDVNDFGVKITLFQGLLRAGKFDTIIEKTTELGIATIVPVECDFSQTKVEVVKRKLDRWQKLAIAASKQSERMDVPKIGEGLEFKNLESVLKEYDEVYFCTIPREKILESMEAVDLRLIEKDINKRNIAFLVGPEGGFSPREHKWAQGWGIKFVYLKTPVLRSETASISLTAIFKFIFS